MAQAQDAGQPPRQRSFALAGRRSPADKPLVGHAPARLPEIWSYGHRNSQSLVIDEKAASGEQEHGPPGGDELNLIRPKLNYSWPSSPTARTTAAARLAMASPPRPAWSSPVVKWVPSIASGTAKLKSAVRRVLASNGFFIGSAKFRVPGARRLGADDRVIGAREALPLMPGACVMCGRGRRPALPRAGTAEAGWCVATAPFHGPAALRLTTSPCARRHRPRHAVAHSRPRRRWSA